MERAAEGSLSDWSALPAGVLVNISAQLPSSAQQAARLVCTAWRDVFEIQTVVSRELDNRELYNICCKYPALVRVNLSESHKLTAGSLRPLSSLTGLTFLSLRGSEGIDNAGRNSLAGLEALTQLRELDVSGVSGTSNAVERVCKLTGLTKLNMSGIDGANCKLDGRLATILSNLTNLRWLSLQGIRASKGYEAMLFYADDLVRQIIEGLPLLEVMDLWGVHFTVSALQSFQRHRSVQTLKIASCHFLTDLTGLHGLPKLSALDAYTYHITSSHPSLTNLPALKSLRISVRDVGAAREDITSLTMLHKLTIVPKNFLMTKRRCAELLQLSQLRVLEISALSAEYLDCDCQDAAGLLTHASLTRLSWTNLSRHFNLRGKSSNVTVPPHDGWAFKALSRSGYSGQYYDGIIVGQIKNLPE